MVDGLDMIILDIKINLTLEDVISDVLVDPNKFCLSLCTCFDELIQVWILNSLNAKQNIFQTHQ